ncbi:MAG TPA: hypothetical protein VGQ58_01725 [Candidatus Limnocylindrales bacterium]|jgi:hypothetical protein|nr:hypothetical protein [Candidatus Limnocylindrales bacterium]
MSVASMAKLAEPGATPPANALNLITAYIPSEALAVYIGALGILVPTAEATPDQIGRVRLVCFLAGLAVAAVIAVANVDAKKIPDPRELWRRRLVIAALAGVAFAIYAAATPSFFVQDTWLTIPISQWAAFAALIGTVAVFPPLAKSLNVRDAEPPKP